MPDAGGRFKGISVPELPWLRKVRITAGPASRNLAEHCAKEHPGAEVVIDDDCPPGNVYMTDADR